MKCNLKYTIMLTYLPLIYRPVVRGDPTIPLLLLPSPLLKATKHCYSNFFISSLSLISDNFCFNLLNKILQKCTILCFIFKNFLKEHAPIPSHQAVRTCIFCACRHYSKSHSNQNSSARLHLAGIWIENSNQNSN